MNSPQNDTVGSLKKERPSPLIISLDKNLPTYRGRLLRRPDQFVMKSALTQRLNNRTLQFTEDGTFQISIFEDLHFAEDKTADANTTNVMKYILGKEDAQLVVLNGDLISGEATHSSNSSDYLSKIVSPLVSAGRLWASTYGNHDSEVNLDPMQDIYEQERQYSNSLTQRSIATSKAGVTNYYLPVYSYGASQDDPPILILWFFDSKGGHYAKNRLDDGRSGARGDWVDESVVEWFLETRANLVEKYERIIPSLAFYHIPAHAMFAYQEQGVDSSKTPGINGETVVPQGAGDTKYTGQDSQFMQALLNTTGLLATFSGHDHDNDWCFRWDSNLTDQELKGNGLNMCYGRHTGYGGYGDAVRGSRQILLDQSTIADEVRTWVRLEDGSISAPVTLNATYGHDRYSKVVRRDVDISAGRSMYDQSELSLIIMLWLSVCIIFYCRH